MVYEERAGFRDELSALLDRIVEPVKVAQHYLGLARSHAARIGGLAGDVNLKKLFYLIRPIVALDWMERHRFVQLPPMSLPDCLAAADVPVAAAEAIRHLIDRKAETREMGTGPIPAPIAEYLEARYGHHEMNARRIARDEPAAEHRRHLAETFYRTTVERLG